MSQVLRCKNGAPSDFQQICIESRRLLVRPVSGTEARDILRYFTVFLTRYMFPGPFCCMDDVGNYIQRSQESLRAGSGLQLAVIKRDNNEFLGCLGLHRYEGQDRLEIGIWIKEPAQGQGLGKEALVAVRDWVAENLDYDVMNYSVDQDNLVSRRLAESMGGCIIEEYRKINAVGVPLNLLVYEIAW